MWSELDICTADKVGDYANRRGRIKQDATNAETEGIEYKSYYVSKHTYKRDRKLGIMLKRELLLSSTGFGWPAGN